jgi:NAD(P)-dependent dehydrogenase (short-subunit alcohol dehydrogenase family)
MPSTSTAHPVRTPFGVSSTSAEVIHGVDLSGRRVLVTGGASGLGTETARALAAAGAQVTLAVRDPSAGRSAAEAIMAATGSRAVDVRLLDLADLGSVAAFAAGWEGPLDVLVNNAGVMALPQLRHSAEGVELQFATNHLGHFALAVGLHGALAAAGGARIVSVSSLVHMASPVVFDDLHFAGRDYHPLLAYAQSKTANVLFAVEAARRWASDGIAVNALHPGVILDTKLMRHVPAPEEPADPDAAPPAYALKTVEQGAATSVLLAGSPLLAGVSGRYFQDSNEAEVVDRQPFDFDLPAAGIAGLVSLSSRSRAPSTLPGSRKTPAPSTSR